MSSTWRWWVAALALALACSGCRSAAPAPDLARPVPTTTAPPVSTTGSPTSVPATDTTPVPTSPPVTAARVVLAADGLGVVRFGDPGHAVVERLTTILGAPTDDGPLGSCPSGEADRLVQFAELGVVLAGAGTAQRFVAWDVGLASGAFPELRTAEGTGVGSTLADLRRAHPGVRVIADDAFGPSFELPTAGGASMRGTLSGSAPGDTVVTLGAGAAACGEAE